MFKKILISNRGEIAVRIIRACRDLGISPVAIFSEADRGALHVKLADEAYCVGPAASALSYLAIDRILETARRCAAEAVHPGYGFLAENEAFAQACADQGLVFIGPSAHSMKVMGDKIASRQAVKKAGVPVIPGTEQAVSSLEEALEQARGIGFPVMLKASAGGGGKGLRRVNNEDELRSVYETARSEAKSSFDDSTVFLEKYLERPRHIEIQLLGDQHGSLIHLGERECSIQRRHQKVLEESPSPLVTPEFRQELGEAAVAVARAVDYSNAGTVEFMVESKGEAKRPSFYFLEMNTRLQVEHPITEMVTGLDLVQEQIRVALGEPLRFGQEEIRLEGCALECRIYAEDPSNNFFPSPGTISTLFEPSGPGIRNDSGMYEGTEITVDYDPLISKLVAHGASRRQAIARMQRALREFKIGGVRTTIPFFKALLAHPEFLKGNLHTRFIEEHHLDQVPPPELDGCPPPLVAAVIKFVLEKEPGRLEPSPRRRNWRGYGRFNQVFSEWKH